MGGRRIPHVHTSLTPSPTLSPSISSFDTYALVYMLYS
jgi:hypothetical protein